ncbi:hypothetical protein [Sporosarcina sp. FSL K6-1508]|uniref:hypothetical protein n=1 Tax=Sporosarcina sp. FSL K6-1508 TaxID=2921553 RepID=UPI0030F78BF2
MDVIIEPLKEAFTKMGMQIISLALIITVSYVVVYLLLSVIKAPVVLRKSVSLLVTAAVSYYAYVEIFLTV